MAFEETKEQQQIYVMFRALIYIFLIIELILFIPIQSDNGIFTWLVGLLKRFGIFNTLWGCKVCELICVGIVCIGTKAERDIKFNVRKMVVMPVSLGIFLTGFCFVFHYGMWGGRLHGMPVNRLLYAAFSVLGVVFIHHGLDAIAKYFNNKVGLDRFNFENESFEQSEKLNANEYSVNIPMVYYWKKKLHKGWINIVNPFRGTLVVGTPGSGKSFGIIDPFIRQHSAKGFAMMVYDFKFPTLAKTLFYQYCKNKKLGLLPENCEVTIQRTR